jgi:hypothetical protein
MQIRCIRARSGVEVGDLAEVPDGAEYSSLYWEPADASPPPVPGTTRVPGSAPPASSPASSAHAKESAS